MHQNDQAPTHARPPVHLALQGALRATVIGAVALGALTSASRTAQAYPQWQFTSGTSRCNQCHLAPAGGGPLTPYGRDAVGEDLSTFTGNGGLLHGALELPPRLAIGGDFRGAFVAKDVKDHDGAKVAVFPMQADLNAWVNVWAGLSLTASAGLRGQAQRADAVVPTQNYQPIPASRLISREHYVSFMPARLGPYVRAGRFFAPFGLRLAEHIVAIRRDLGFNQLEESYNVSGGFLEPHWELHLTAFSADIVRNIGGHEAGGAAYFERRLFDVVAVGAQAKAARGLGVNRAIGGLVAKVHVPVMRSLLLAEGNVVRLGFPGSEIGPRYQFVGAAGLASVPMRGFMLTVLAERKDGDLRVPGAAMVAGLGMLSWFPYPHVELQLTGVLQAPDAAARSTLLLAQLHYFL